MSVIVTRERKITVKLSLCCESFADDFIRDDDGFAYNDANKEWVYRAYGVDVMDHISHCPFCGAKLLPPDPITEGEK